MSSEVKLSDTLSALLGTLADGAFHSGEALGECVGISRAAVWKQLQQLQGLGIDIERCRGRGYALSRPLILLDVERICASLSTEVYRSVSVRGVQQIPSTNKYLMDAIHRGEDARGQVCIAEQQSAGSGRRGRPWQSPFGANIYFSMAWRFATGVAALEGLSLAVGVAVSRALSVLGFPAVGLKWPNDLLWQNQKLGGVLLEIAGDASGECYVVIGIGLNVRMPDAAGQSIDQPWTDLAALVSASESAAELASSNVDLVTPTLDRNLVIAAMLEQLVPMLMDYERTGFAPWRDSWQSLNCYRGQLVSVSSTRESICGVLLGVDDSGALELDVDGQRRQFVGGELSLRTATTAFEGRS